MSLEIEHGQLHNVSCWGYRVVRVCIRGKRREGEGRREDGREGGGGMVRVCIRGKRREGGDRGRKVRREGGREGGREGR